jgi:putative ABC transport system permease protein
LPLLFEREMGTRRARGRMGAVVWGLWTIISVAFTGLWSTTTAATFQGFGADLKQGMVSLRRAPGFTATAVLTLGVGIGAVSTIFTVVEGVLLRDLPYADADRLVMIAETNGSAAGAADPTLRELQARTSLHDGVYGESRWPANVIFSGVEPQVLTLQSVSPGLFEMLGWTPEVGRGFNDADGFEGAGRVVLISHSRWIQSFGADPNAVGRTVDVNGITHQIVGVMPAGFRPVQSRNRPIEPNIAMWAPIIRIAALDQDPALRYGIVMKMREGVAIEDVAVAGNEVLDDLRNRLADWRTGPQWHVETNYLRDEIVGEARPLLTALFGAVGFLLLLATANLANLQLARAAGRLNELSLLRTLGASSWRVSRRLMIEAGLLGIAGALVGLALAIGGTQVLVALEPAGLPMVDTIAVNPTVVLATAALGILTGLVLGLITAGRVSFRDAAASLRMGARNTIEGQRGLRGRRLLVVAEVGLVVVLLVGFGLMGRSLWNLAAVDPGMSIDDRIAFQVTLPASRYAGQAEIDQFVDATVAAVQAVPGVAAVSASTGRPMAASYWNFLFRQGDEIGASDPPRAYVEEAQPGFISLMGLPLLAGRDLRREDRAEDAEPVAILNRAAVERFFPDEDPVGRFVGFDETGPWLRVVGVTDNVVSGSLSQGSSIRIYVPRMSLSLPWRIGNRWFVVQSAGPAAAVLRAPIVSAVLQVDGDQPISGYGPLTELRQDLLAEQRFRSLAFGVFAVLGLTLGVVGVYGVVSYSVTRGKREAALRAALGAAPSTLLWFVLNREGQPVVLGAVLGAVGAAGLSRLLVGLVYGISPLDPLTIGAATMLAITFGGIAIWLPARHMGSVQPTEALAGD